MSSASIPSSSTGVQGWMAARLGIAGSFCNACDGAQADSIRSESASTASNARRANFCAYDLRKSTDCMLDGLGSSGGGTRAKMAEIARLTGDCGW